MQRAILTAVLLALIGVPVSEATLLRSGSGRDQSLVVSGGDPDKPKDIHKKWDKMDEFLGIMFTMACKWKHGKDVHGVAAEKLKEGDIDGADGYKQEVKDIQAENVKGLVEACGNIVASGKKKCRQGCADRWNEKMGKRNGCDEKCVSVYDTFETSCKSKVDNLAKVYDQKNERGAAQQQCYKGHCKEFPMVWMKAEESEMKDEVKTQCEKRCTDDAIKAGCQKAWALKVDFIAADVASKCAEDSGVTKCFSSKKDSINSDYDKCKSDTKKTCGDAYDECTKKGKVDDTFKDAKAFCTDRKKLCSKQADEKCLDENKSNLKEAQKKCEDLADKELTKCKEDTLKKKEEDAEKKCISEETPTCKKDCSAKCEVGKMNACLKTLEQKDDPTKLFCVDFWNLLHESSEVDPVTGNPIVLLSSKANLTIA